MANPNDSPWRVFVVTGELDMSRIDELDELVGSAFDGARVNAIFDLSGVSFMDSSALRWFLKVQDRIDLSTGQLRLVAPSDGHLQRLLGLTGLADRFSVFPSRIEGEATAVDATDGIEDLVATLSNQRARAETRPTPFDSAIWEQASAAGIPSPV